MERLVRRYVSLYCLLLASIAGVSLVLAYHTYASPAWYSDYGYAFSGTLRPEQISQATPPPPRFSGLVIEAGRTTLLLICFFLILGITYTRDVAAFFAIRDRETRGAWPYRIALVLLLTVILAAVVYYHLRVAPEKLSDSSKYWKILRSGEQAGKWWNCQDPYWKRVFEDTSLPTPSWQQPDSSEYRRLYRLPYLAYLPYSITNFCLLLVPLFIIGVFSARSRLSRGAATIRDFVTKVEHAKKLQDCDLLIECASQTMQITARLPPRLERFSMALLLGVTAALYEKFLGYRTLAPMAIVLTVVAYTGFIVATLVLFPAIWNWNLVITDLISTFDTNEVCSDLPLDKRDAIVDQLKQQRLVPLMQDMGLTVVLPWALSAVGLVVAAL